MLLSGWRFWLGLGGSLLLLFLLLRAVDPGEVLLSLREADHVYAVPAVGIYFVAVYFRAVRWRFLLSPVGNFPVGRLYPVVVMGCMVNNLLPVRLGELARSWFLSREGDASGTSVLATIAVERVYDGLALLALAAVSAPALLVLGEFDRSHDALRTGAMFLAPAVVLLFVSALAVLTLASSPLFPLFVEVPIWPLEM